jgi:hypothetical protein
MDFSFVWSTKYKYCIEQYKTEQHMTKFSVEQILSLNDVWLKKCYF